MVAAWARGPRGAILLAMARSTFSHARRFGDGTAEAAITIRAARQDDAAALTTLAALDSARPLTGDRVVAEVDGRIVAAVSRDDGRSIADPFTASANAVEMLRVRNALPVRPRRRPSFGGFGNLGARMRPRLA